MGYESQSACPQKPSDRAFGSSKIETVRHSRLESALSIEFWQPYGVHNFWRLVSVCANILGHFLTLPVSLQIQVCYGGAAANLHEAATALTANHSQFKVAVSQEWAICCSDRIFSWTIRCMRQFSSTPKYSCDHSRCPKTRIVTPLRRPSKHTVGFCLCPTKAAKNKMCYIPP